MAWHIIRPFNYQITLTIVGKAQKDSHLSKEPHATKEWRAWEEIVFPREDHTDCYTLSYVNPEKNMNNIKHICVCIQESVHTHVY